MFLFKKKPKVSVQMVSVDRNGKEHEIKGKRVSDAKIKKLIKEQEHRQKIEQQYKRVLDEHFSLIETIKTEYSAALKKGIDSRAMNKVVALCKADIALSGKIKDYCKKIGDPLYTLPAYERLAIIYEKRGEIDKAIEVCKASIAIGNHKDDFQARMKRLKARQ